MAVTRLIPIHPSTGRSVLQSFKARTDYAVNPDKTDNGQLVTAYECDPQTVAEEFALARRNYIQITGRHHSNEVIAYQLRQSFSPGEVTPEEANKIGCELADRFLKGKHAYIVATHTDKAHIHNHIIFCATALDCTRKFRNFLGSGKALARLSDSICIEHELSVLLNPKKHQALSYPKWAVINDKTSKREKLKYAIDEALAQKPEGFDALIKLLGDAGWRIKHGKQYSFCGLDGERFIRLDTLGDEYSEQALRDVLAGQRVHVPYQKNRYFGRDKLAFLIDIKEQLDAGKIRINPKVAQLINLKRMGLTFVFLNEVGVRNYQELTARIEAAEKKLPDLKERLKASQTRMEEISEQKQAIYNYLKTKDVYAAWRASGWSKSFAEEHKDEIEMHKEAKRLFDRYGGKKLPTIKQLNAEYNTLIAERKKLYVENRTVKEELKKLNIAKSNIDDITRDIDQKPVYEKESGEPLHG